MHAPSEPTLAALQSRMAAALLAGDAAGQALPEELFAGAHPGAVGLRVHRNTVLGAISNALRLCYVAVDRLVGEEFFDRMAVAYARAQPPRAPQLDAYGADFAQFIAGFPGTDALPYLAELAHFEWQFAALARQCGAPEAAGPALELEGGVRLRFAAPLRLHEAGFPVERLRAAILADDAAALAAVPAGRGRFHYALWRTSAGVNVRELSALSARFLAAVYAGADGAGALAAAGKAGTAASAGEAGESGAAAIAATLAQEILPAGFVRAEVTGSA